MTFSLRFGLYLAVLWLALFAFAVWANPVVQDFQPQTNVEARP